MISLDINNQSYFFSVAGLTEDYVGKLIYTVRLNDKTYYLFKAVRDNDCRQLDSHPRLDGALLSELCKILTEIEREYQTRSSIDFINQQIIRILARIRSLRPKRLA